MKPFVTILMASYGRLPLLKESVASAQQQNYENYEILIVDDGSDEKTKEWLRQQEQQNSELRVIFQQHKGVAVARNSGVLEAKGDLICILDSDDTLVTDALTVLVSTQERYSAALVYSYIRERRTHSDVIVSYPVFQSAPQMLYATLLKPRVPFKHSGTMFTRDRAIELGSYDTSLPCKIDIDFYLKFLKAGHLPRLVRQPLVDFKMHKDSISRNRKQGLEVWYKLIDKYGPANPVKRLFLKAMRTLSENLKRAYIELTAS